MVHRIRLNRRRLFGPDYQVVSANTTTWTSGNTTVSNTVEFNQRLYNKNIVIPLELKFEPADYSDLIDSWVDRETQRVINKILDGEKIKYSSKELDGVTISFRFSDRDDVNGSYTTNYNGNGFNLPEEYKLNRFKKSYFRLYFYDSNNSETANLLFVEDLPIQQSNSYGPGVENAVFVLKNLYWDKEDALMDNTLTDRIIFMDARFFNAKTGQVQTFYNPPISKVSPVGVSEYSNVINRGWRTSPIKLINPNNNQGEYRFEVINGFGGNTSNSITLSEFILK